MHAWSYDFLCAFHSTCALQLLLTPYIHTCVCVCHYINLLGDHLICCVTQCWNWTPRSSRNNECSHTNSLSAVMQKVRSNKPPSQCSATVQDSNTPPPPSMNNEGIPYVSACKTRSPTVGLRKLSRPKGWPRGNWEGGGVAGGRLSRSKQTTKRCPTSEQQIHSGLGHIKCRPVAS